MNRCGTMGGVSDHRLNDSPTCNDCKQARRVYNHHLRRHGPNPKAITPVTLDYLETHGETDAPLLLSRIREKHPRMHEQTLRDALNRLVADGRVEKRPRFDAWGISMRESLYRIAR